MRSWMREHSLECSQSRFTAGSLSQGKHPAFAELKAKAHNARVMLAWIADVSRAAVVDDDHSRLRATMVWALASLCWTCDSHKDWAVPPAVADRIYQLGHAFLASYQALAVWGVGERRRLYAWKPKFHYFEHMLDRIVEEGINFTYLWNYGEEDVIGTAINIASQTHRLTVPRRTLGRYFLRLGLAFSGREKPRPGRPPWLDP